MAWDEGGVAWCVGYFNAYAIAEANGKRWLAHLAANKVDLDWYADPGYGGTAAMSVQAALSMVLRRNECPGFGGGVFTPSSALGQVLVEQLRKAGFTLTVRPFERNSPLPTIKQT